MSIWKASVEGPGVPEVFVVPQEGHAAALAGIGSAHAPRVLAFVPEAEAEVRALLAAEEGERYAKMAFYRSAIVDIVAASEGVQAAAYELDADVGTAHGVYLERGEASPPAVVQLGLLRPADVPQLPLAVSEAGHPLLGQARVRAGVSASTARSAALTSLLAEIDPDAWADAAAPALCSPVCPAKDAAEARLRAAEQLALAALPRVEGERVELVEETLAYAGDEGHVAGARAPVARYLAGQLGREGWTVQVSRAVLGKALHVYAVDSIGPRGGTAASGEGARATFCSADPETARVRALAFATARAFSGGLGAEQIAVSVEDVRGGRADEEALLAPLVEALERTSGAAVFFEEARRVVLGYEVFTARAEIRPTGSSAPPAVATSSRPASEPARTPARQSALPRLPLSGHTASEPALPNAAPSFSIGNLFDTATATFVATLAERLGERLGAGAAEVQFDLLLNGKGLLQDGELLRQGPRRGLYYLFSYDRVHVVHDAGRAAGPCVECFMRHAIDNHSYPEVRTSSCSGSAPRALRCGRSCSRPSTRPLPPSACEWRAARPLRSRGARSGTRVLPSPPLALPPRRTSATFSRSGA